MTMQRNSDTGLVPTNWKWVKILNKIKMLVVLIYEKLFFFKNKKKNRGLGEGMKIERYLFFLILISVFC